MNIGIIPKRRAPLKEGIFTMKMWIMWIVCINLSRVRKSAKDSGFPPVFGKKVIHL